MIERQRANLLDSNRWVTAGPSHGGFNDIVEWATNGF
jgi:hypothetical protein